MPIGERQLETKKKAGGTSTRLNESLASEAVIDGLKYLQTQWKWKGTDIGRVLHIPPTTINGWFRKGSLRVSEPISPEVQLVIHLLAIHRNLSAMFSEPFHQIEWLNSPHPDFSGISPVERMTESAQGLIFVRQYLDYVRGRGA
jgi:hypothetical protein